MTEFLIYIIKSTVYLSVFYAFFILFMKNTTFFRFNRIVFLAASAMCFILPAVEISPSIFDGVNMPMNVIEEALGPAYASTIDGITITPIPINLWLIIVSVIYFTGFITVLGSNIASYIRLYKLLHMNQAECIDGIKVLRVDMDMPSFSWGRYIVISRSDLESSPAIFTHERMHIKCRHTIDLMLHSIITTMHWFNPLVWIARMELKMLHEYEADELTLKTGISSAQYQLLLVKKTVDAKQFQMANGFYHSKLKNRIMMINKKKTNRWMRLAYIICIPAIIGAMCCCSQRKDDMVYKGVSVHISSNTTKVDLEDFTSADLTSAIENAGGAASDMSVEVKYAEDTPQEVIDALKDELRSMSVLKLNISKTSGESLPYGEIFEKPTFEGNDANAFAKWVYGQVKYPQQCIDEKIEGRVVIQFTINNVGEVTDVTVLRGVCPALDEEAVRAVKASPAWTPGKTEDGKAVPVTFTFPIVFKLG